LRIRALLPVEQATRITTYMLLHYHHNGVAYASIATCRHYSALKPWTLNYTKRYELDESHDSVEQEPIYTVSLPRSEGYLGELNHITTAAIENNA
jgi:hypothetical protein